MKDKPDNPTVISALFWIGKAKAHEGKIDEAKKLAADTIKKYIDDRNREAVEQLITQLTQLCVKKKRPHGNRGRGVTRIGCRGEKIPAPSSSGCSG